MRTCVIEPGFGSSGPACRWGRESGGWRVWVVLTRCDYDERGIGLEFGSENGELRTEGWVLNAIEDESSGELKMGMVLELAMRVV